MSLITALTAPVPAGLANVPSWVKLGFSDPVEEAPVTAPLVSTLPAKMNEAYRMRLQGKGLSEIGVAFSVTRQTIAAWLKRVESEYLEAIRTEPSINQMSAECQRLTDLEQQARTAAEATKDQRAKSAFLSEARRCVTARANIKTVSGAISREADKVWIALSKYQPVEVEDADGPYAPLNREKIIHEIVKQMERTRLP